MSLRWRWVIPAFGLMLFFGETYGSIRLNRELRIRNHYRKDFYWGTFRLQTDPLGRIPPAPCPADIPDCGAWWSIRDVIVDPGPILTTLLISGLPAFFLALRTVHALGRLGVNEVYSFFVTAPILILVWYYFLGWLLDHWRSKRKSKLLTPR